MIWYILYPFRGTTEPPKLSPSHPIRRAFQLHGTATARHWLWTILVTVAISVLLCYPVLFHTDSPAATGLRNLPHHVWTTVTDFEGNRPADVEMHQVWVHGDYMKAIEPRVLRKALCVQNALLAPGSDGIREIEGDAAESASRLDSDTCTPESEGVSWGYHSPLMYWDCSRSILDADSDLLATINKRSEEQTFLNFTLRPSSVFAGKAFTRSKLRAADAAVITLFDKSNVSLGKIWQSRSKALARDLTPDWSMYPEDGQIVSSRLYEFRFKPMSIYDDLSLALLYFLMATYVIYRVGKMRAIKSKVGLVITIFFKMSVSVIASFTVCSFLGINLTHIPRETFPFLVMVFGIGNIFRLLNEVLTTPPEMPPIQRISNSIGEVGHISLARAFQNLVVLYILSQSVTPWVKPFCAFAAVTLVFDFVFHITFFLAVLSVEVQRMELQDSLTEVSVVQPSQQKPRRQRHTWLEALRLGRLPFSTRLAGSAGVASFILALNWHFFDTTSQTFSLGRLLERLLARDPPTTNNHLWTPPPINQARTPAEWLRMQDHNTAKELISFIKPGAHSFIARVYDPLLVVLKNADGRKPTPNASSWLERVRSLAHEHAFNAALVVVFTIAVVTILMNYLLWNGAPEDREDGADNTVFVSVTTLPIPHSLDVVKLSSCSKGHLISIGLDRSTSVWLYETGKGYTHVALQTAKMEPRLWPIISSAIDEGGGLLALCSNGGQIGLWSLSTYRFVLFPVVELRGQLPLLFSFASVRTGEVETVSLFVVTVDGYLTDVDTRTGTHRTSRISLNPITSTALLTGTKAGTSLVFTSKSEGVHILPLHGPNHMTSKPIPGFDPRGLLNSEPSNIKSVFPVSSLRLLFVIRSQEVDIVDFQTRALIHTLHVGKMKTNSFRVIHSNRRVCSCGAPAVHSLSIIYTEPRTGQMEMHTFTIDGTSSSQICLSKNTEGKQHDCQRLDRAVMSVHHVNPPGVWETTHAQTVLGVRKRPTISTLCSSSASGADTSYSASKLSGLNLRARGSRRAPSLRGNSDPHPESDNWEAWSLTSSGEFRSRPLLCPASTDDPSRRGSTQDQLFVANAGPVIRLGQRSVAVAFGNSVKIVTLGKEGFGAGATDDQDPSIASYQWRTRKGTSRKLH